MADTYKFAGADGVEHTFVGDRPPTPDEIQQLTGGKSQATAAPYVPDSPLAHHLNEQEGGGDWGQNIADAGRPFAHPQTAGDIAGLLLPSGGAAALGKVLRPVGDAVTKYGGAAAEIGASLLPTKAKAALGVLKQLSPTEWNSPLTVAGREGRAIAASQRFNALPLSEQMKSFPGTPAPTVTRGQAPPIRNLGNEAPLPPPPGPSGPHLDLSVPMRPSEMTPQQLRERLTSGFGTPPAPVEKPPLGSKMPMSADPLQPIAPSGRPPITVSPESLMQPPTPESGLQQPRASVGAEVVGRQNGMTTQQVRDATGPIRGEAPGAAAGMPSKPMDRILQKLIDMGPKGQGLPESAREGYAASATSDKARFQIQAALDALRKVGFVGAAATAPSVMRGKLVSGIQDQE